VSRNRANSLHNFTVAAPTGAAFQVTSPFQALVEVTQNPPEPGIIVAPGTGSPEWLLPAGNHQVRVGSTSVGGGFTLTSNTTASNSGCKRRFISAPGTYSGQSIAATDCEFGDGSWYDAFGIYSPRPCSIRFRGTAFLEKYIWIYDQFDVWLGTATVEFDPATDALIGLPACRYLNEPIFFWIGTADLGDVGEVGPYTITVTFFDIPPTAQDATAVPIVKAMRAPGKASAAVLARKKAMGR
jgi:hypothetical protein